MTEQIIYSHTNPNQRLVLLSLRENLMYILYIIFPLNGYILFNKIQKIMLAFVPYSGIMYSLKRNILFRVMRNTKMTNNVYIVYRKTQKANDPVVCVFSSQEKADQFIKEHGSRPEWSLYPDWLYYKEHSVL